MPRDAGSDQTAPRDEEDFSHYFNATGRLSAEVASLRVENEALRQAARPIVEACETATRIIGLTDFREVRIHDTEWRALSAALQSEKNGAARG